MASIAAIRDAGERAPLIDQRPTSSDQEGQQLRPRTTGLSIPFRLNVRRSKLVPILGILIVFFNESEFYLKSAGLVRAIEAIACLEYYQNHHSPLAELGKSIPEFNCKNSAIQERVAKLYGASFAFRMVCAAIGTFFIITFFSTGRRRPVLIVHKVNLIVTQALVFIACKETPRR